MPVSESYPSRVLRIENEPSGVSISNIESVPMAERPKVDGLTDGEATRLTTAFAELLKDEAWYTWPPEEVGHVALMTFVSGLAELSPLDYSRVRFSCDCGAQLSVTFGYPIANRHELLTFLIDHGHAPKATGIALRKVI